VISLSNSSLGAFNRCRRYWKYRYLDKWEPEQESADLKYGTAFHAAMAAYWTGERNTEELVRIAFKEKHPQWMEETLRIMIKTYVVRWEDQDIGFTPLLVEDKQRIDVDGVTVTVVFDALVRSSEGKILLIEHKTTRSGDISTGGAWYLRKLTDTQTKIYAFAAAKLGFPVDAVVYDVIRRPTFKRKDNEEEVTNKPDAFLQRHVMKYSSDTLDSCIKDVKAAHKLMLYCEQTGTFDRNGDSCQAFNRECEYYQECWGKE